MADAASAESAGSSTALLASASGESVTLVVYCAWEEGGRARKRVVPRSHRCLSTLGGLTAFISESLNIVYAVEAAFFETATNDFIVSELPSDDTAAFGTYLSSALEHGSVVKVKLFQVAGCVGVADGALSATKYIPKTSTEMDRPHRDHSDDGGRPSLPPAASFLNGSGRTVYPTASSVTFGAAAKVALATVRPQSTPKGGLPDYGAMATRTTSVHRALRSSASYYSTDEEVAFGGAGTVNAAAGDSGAATPRKRRRHAHRRLFPFEAHDKEVSRPHLFVDSSCSLTIYDYSGERFECWECMSVADIAARPKPAWATVRWINVEGIDVAAIAALADMFHLHPVAVKTAMTLPHQPQVERYQSQFFVLVYAMHIFKPDGELKEVPVEDGRNYLFNGVEFRGEQVSMFVLRDTVITIQEAKYPTTSFDAIWKGVVQRVEYESSHVREGDASMLMYAVLDAVVDNFFPITSHWGNKAEDVEDAMALRSTREGQDCARMLKSELKKLRVLLWQTNDIVITLQSDDMISASTKQYISDVADHISLNVQVCSTYIDTAASIMEMYGNAQSEKLNRTMMILTIVSNLFLPLMFVTGIYGMNFEHLPELKWKYGYLYFWIFVVVATVVQTLLFRYYGFLC